MIVLLLLLLIVGAPIDGAVASAAERPPGSAAWLPRLFGFGETTPAPLRRAAAAYEEGRFFDALGHLRDLEAGDADAGEDDTSFLRALALRGLGWDDLAVPFLTSVLEARPPSDYYPLALLELVEIHYRAERIGAVGNAFSRYFEEPLRSPDPDSRRIATLLFEFGDLRVGGAKLTPSEKQLLSRPKELAVLRKKRRERTTDRLIYLSGLARLRSGQYSQSLDALRRVGLKSPYSTYALYTIAQDLFALGDESGAMKMLGRLVRYPETRPYERGVESQARLLQARMLFRSGALERGIRAAASVPDDDPHAGEARLLIAQALVDAGQPALALAYARRPSSESRSFELEARQGLALGLIHRDLGDSRSAAQTFREATSSLRRARLEDAALDDAVARLSALAAAATSERLRRQAELRRHVSEGVRRTLAFEGSGAWNLARLVRAARVALGLRPYGVLAMGAKPDAPKPVAQDGLWLAYLRSSQRTAVDRALTRLGDLDVRFAKPSAETALRIVNAYVTWLEYGIDPARPDASTAVARRVARFVSGLRNLHGLEIPPLDLDPHAPLGPRLARYRMALVMTPPGHVPETAAFLDALTETRSDAATLLQEWSDDELRRFLEDRAGLQGRLEFDLEMALAHALARDPEAGKPGGEAR